MVTVAGSHRVMLSPPSHRWILPALIVAAPLALEVHTSPTLVVTPLPVSRGTIARRVVERGTLEAVAAVEVVSEVTGQIDAVNVGENAEVKAGDVLARIDSGVTDEELRDAEELYRKADAEFIAAGAAAAAAKERLDRAESLTSARMIARAEVDATETGMDEANVDVATAES